jgi:hypothetical protein
LNRAGVAARARHQRHQPKPVAAVDRQALDLPLLDPPGQLGFLRIDERRLALDRDRLGDGRNLQLEVERRRVADREADAFLGHRAEAGQLRRNLVDADRHRGHHVSARRRGDRRADRAGIDMGRRDGGARQRRAAFVQHGSAQFGLPDLRTRWSREQTRNEQGQ